MSVFCQVAATPYLAYETVASWRRGKSLARATVCTGCRPGKRSATGERFPGGGVNPLPGYGVAPAVAPVSVAPAGRGSRAAGQISCPGYGVHRLS
ncbi:TPA: hypothetical protein ACTZE7_005392, partial [Raoultella planticola]